MKKYVLLTILTFLSLNSFAQKIIENPNFVATTVNYVTIAKIELQDTATIVDFEVKYFPNWWISVDSNKTYLQDSKGGKKYYVKSAKGIELNQKHYTPENGINHYTLYFPPLEKNIQSIDFIEERWKIFDIDLINQEETTFIPKELQGNWLKTDGSNEWTYGIYNDKVIYNSQVWDNVSVYQKGKEFEFILKNDFQQEKIYLKKKKDKLLIGSSLNKMQVFSKTKTFNPNYKIKNDEEYKLPIFKADTAIYKGYIKGYHPKMGKTGIIYVDNVITNNQESYLINIEPNGSFYAKILMIYPHNTYVRMLSFKESVFLEPGKTTFQLIDLSEYTSAFKGQDDFLKRERKSLFMGDFSNKINSDLLMMQGIGYFDYDQMKNATLEMTGEDYKKYCLNNMERELEALSSLEEKNSFSKKALQIKRMRIVFNTYINILEFNRKKSFAYKEKDQTANFKEETFKPSYYDFINTEYVNNPLSVIEVSYENLINRIRFSDIIRPKSNFYFNVLLETFNEKNISLTKEQKEVLNKLANCENNKEYKKIITSNEAVLKSIEKNYGELLDSISKDIYYKTIQKNRNKYFNLNSGFATELMFAQSKFEAMESLQEPLEKEEIEEIKKNITNDFIKNYIIKSNEIKSKEIEEKLIENKAKTGYSINETPNTESDKLFDSIIEKYKGNVILVDFWATWCGPCRNGIKEIEPLKEELKGENIKFVYITNNTSPIDTWKLLIPDIKGEHYRLSQDEWNYLSSKFKISGIPHYVLVDKNGVVVKDKLKIGSSSNLKMILDEYLEK